MVLDYLTDRLGQSPTGRIMHELNLSRVRFNSHPLYRRWSLQAYEGKLAYWADEIPDKVAQYLPLAFMAAPLLAVAIALLFGSSVLSLVFSSVVVLLVALILLVAAAGPLLAAGIAAFALAQERETGRWELLMLMPYDRISVLMMRVTTMLFPYRPLIATLEVLQTLAAVLVAVILNAGAASNEYGSHLMTACVLFFLPCLLILTWERRQDYAVSIALGTFAGINPKEKHALGWAFGGAASMIFTRALLALLTLALSPVQNGMGTFLPAFVAGPAILPMLGVPLGMTAIFWMLYYGIREGMIITLWLFTVRRIEGRE